MIYVCDAIMGTGKSQSAITYMNEHSDQKFIYITPYLDESTRIRNGCKKLRFVEPSNKLESCNFTKRDHTAMLIKQGRNITTTHQAFKNYTQEMLDDIRFHEYTILIDESVDVLEKYDIHPDDLKMVIDCGYVNEIDGVCRVSSKKYCGNMYSDMFRMLRSRELIRMNEGDSSVFFWALPPDLISAFKDVIVMTYMFEGQSIHHFFEMYHMKYTYIGIERTDEGNGYRFCDYPGYVPEYTKHMRDMIHILDNPRLNEVGDAYNAMSMTWYDTNDQGVDQLRRNVYNCINNIWSDVPADKKMWGTYKGAAEKIKGRGYSKSFVTFNIKATNQYRGRDHLVYVPNIYMNVREKTFYERNGIVVDEDKYALSIMVQWIWRSAIRDGDEVSIYIPSKRMRTILTDWIASFDEGGEVVD